ncbi:MAG: hypothetical protein RAO92_04615 [Candidatus Euphemobacter frigidus]|nr:hypothetical protein [Candidatus Euphemobacter frigidus]MDP8275670.1 hypothetical protein [Candidatus Euphemobacter frigidus]
MRVYKRETERLKRAENLIGEKFPRFGVNKNREIVRLIYEISKREDIPSEAVLPADCPLAFGRLKEYLLKRRFPESSAGSGSLRSYLPGFSLDLENCLQPRPGPFRPRRIFVEESARNSDLAGAFRAAFPRAEYSEIPTLKHFLAGRKYGGIPEYNKRTETAFIVSEEFDFFKRCPCTPRAVPCGYHIFNLSFGCIYECAYCYLQEYANVPGIIFPANIEKFLERFASYRNLPSSRSFQRGPFLRLGTGEFSDSLMLDDLTGYSIPLVEFFSRQDGVIFEFKTKSANIENLLRLDPAGKIVIAWSLNPQKIIDDNELYTANLSERLDAARRVAEAGYGLAFHFDPVFYFRGWEDEYRGVIESLFSLIDPERIAWISLGTLRFKPSLKKIIESRFPANQILDAEMVLGYDNKLRYPAPIRSRIYRFLIDELEKHHRALPLYLCMEERSLWRELKLPFPF